MPKSIWIRAIPDRCVFSGGKLDIELLCGHYNAIGEKVYEEPVYTRDIPGLLCFTKGMINSSMTALVQIKDGWAPLGRISSKFDLRRGVGIQYVINDFSRDGNIECVRTKDDAEKLCLLEQKLPGTNFTIYDVAKFNEFEVDRLTARSIRALKIAIESRLQHCSINKDELLFDAKMKTMILAGKQTIK